MASPLVNNTVRHWLLHRTGQQQPVVANPIVDQYPRNAHTLLSSILQQDVCFNASASTTNSSSGRGSGASSPTAKSGTSSGLTPPTTDDSNFDYDGSSLNKSPTKTATDFRVKPSTSFTVNNILGASIEHGHHDMQMSGSSPYLMVPLPIAGHPNAVAPMSFQQHHNMLTLPGLYPMNQMPYAPYGPIYSTPLNYQFGLKGSAFTPVNGSRQPHSLNFKSEAENGNQRTSPVVESSINGINDRLSNSTINTNPATSTAPKFEPLLPPYSNNLQIVVDSVSAASSPLMNGSQISSYDGSHDSPLSNASRSNSPNCIPLPANSNAKCLVCDDKASGYHYGVVSCEGCKGFFRRTVQKDIKYNCHKEKKCPVTRITRNRCQFCRFKKCLDTGMAKDSVRQDRNRKRKHCDEDEEAKIRATSKMQSVIRTVLNAHNDTMTTIEFEQNQRLAANYLCNSTIDDGLNKIYQFAQQIPGFQELSLYDQEILRRFACLEILALRCAFINAGRSSPAPEFDKNYLNNTPGFSTFVDSVTKLKDTFRQLNIMDEEVALLCAICLMCPSRSGLVDVASVEKYQDSLLNSLSMQMNLRRSDNPHHPPHYFPKLLMKLSDIRTLSLLPVSNQTENKADIDNLLNRS